MGAVNIGGSKRESEHRDGAEVPWIISSYTCVISSIGCRIIKFLLGYLL